MAIVPNLNGVQISNNTPLVDPRNLSTKERMFVDDNYSSSTEIILVNNNQLLIPASQLRNCIMFANGKEDAATVYISTAIMTAVGQGIPLFGGNGFNFKGRAAQSPFYCWGVAGVPLTLMWG